MTHIHQVSTDEAFATLRSAPSGLSSAEAERRHFEYGPNRVRQVGRASMVLRFFKEFTSFFSLILWVAAALAFVAEWSAPGQGMARLGYAIIAVILISGSFSFWQEYRVERTLAALRHLLPPQVKALREGKAVQVDADQLVPGDIVLLEQGDHIPADCRVIEAFGVRVNNATVTGESLPAVRDTAPSAESDLIRAKNIFLAGTAMLSGQAKALVFAIGMDTELGKIAHLTQAGRAAVSPLRKELAYLSRLIALMAVVIGLTFFVISWTLGAPFWEDFIFAIGIIVAMVPEGLLPTLTLALVLATQRMAKRNVLIRYLPAVETLGSTTVICTDKTGTLTQNRMAVKQLYLGDEFASLDKAEAKRYRPFFLTALLCHALKEGEQQGKRIFFGDPMEIALAETARRLLPAIPIYRRLDEIPFDADRMRVSTLYEMPDGPTLFCKGAPEALFPLCDSILVKGEIRPFTAELHAQARAAQETMAAQGLRVLAFAHRPMEQTRPGEAMEEKLIFSGLVGLEDPPRPEVAAAIRRCGEAGIRVIMVTGDHPDTAVAIAREIGLVQLNTPLVLTGEKLSGLSDTQLRLALDTPEIVFARVSADHKMRIVEALKEKQHVVAVTGDGVNDAPALKSAHIGIAMGIAGTDVAKEAADMVLLDDNFASIVNAVEEGRAVFDNIRKFLTYILAHNVPELIPYIGFALLNIPLALTPIQMLAVDLGTDSLTALGLGVEKPDPQIMQRPPRPQHQRLLDWPLALRSYLFLGLVEAIAAMGAFFFVLLAAGWEYGQILNSNDLIYLQATTACLSAIVVMQIVNVFLCRSTNRSAFSVGLFGNRLIVWGVLLELVLIILIDYSPWGNAMLDTAPITGKVWLFIVPFAIGLFILEEVRKWFVRNWRRNKPAIKRISAGS